MVSIQEIKSGLWWRAYGRLFVDSIFENSWNGEFVKLVLEYVVSFCLLYLFIFQTKYTKWLSFHSCPCGGIQLKLIQVAEKIENSWNREFVNWRNYLLFFRQNIQIWLSFGLKFHSCHYGGIQLIQAVEKIFKNSWTKVVSKYSLGVGLWLMRLMSICLQWLTNLSKVSFKSYKRTFINYVDKIWPIIDYLPTHHLLTFAKEFLWFEEQKSGLAVSRPCERVPWPM